MSLTIRTNIPSIIAQGSLTKSTNALNTAIERMTTGLKINSAKDNAAGYSIVNDMTTKLSSWDVAEDNVKMGIDLLNTANDTTSQMQAHGERLMALCIQARNGTYGDSSLSAIQAEANARVAEVARIYQSVEYNGINLFDKITPILKQKGLDTVAQDAGLTSDITASKGPNGKFIEDIVEETPGVNVINPDELLTAIQNNTKIGIGNAETLAKLAELVNSGTTCSGKTIILTDDIDLSAYHTGTGWTPIGNNSKQFKGTFNGNGHVVSNLYINNLGVNIQGLFGSATGEFKNIGVENCYVIGGNSCGGLVGKTDKDNSSITNCYATGYIVGYDDIGGIVGTNYSSITYCYATGNVKGKQQVGGLAGQCKKNNATITNSYATGNVSDRWDFAGGLVGRTYANITNCYATGNVDGQSDVGGLVGIAHKNTTVTNSYSTGNVSGQERVGGLTGAANENTTVTNCYATGDVNSGGEYDTGGLVGYAKGDITNSYATGNVSGTSYVGGLVGNGKAITNSYATGNVSGTDSVGGLAGRLTYGNITNSVSFAKEVKGTTNVGSFVGEIKTSDIEIKDCNCMNISGLNKTGNGTDEQNNGITYLNFDTQIQVGIYGDDNSYIKFDTSFSYDLSAVLSDIASDNSFSAIQEFMNILNTKATSLGSITNRLDSAIDSIQTNYENLVSSRSTLRDTDVAKESSEYIKQQILQQASATLLSTANQSPSIALQLI